MTTRPWAELRNEIDTGPEHQILVAQFQRAMETAEALGAALETQQDAASTTCVEHEEDAYLSALRHYTELLGGRLEIRAIFPDRTVELVPASDDSAE